MNDKLDAPAETEEKKRAPGPHQLKDRVRVCGRWQKKGYRPTAEELAKWKEHCKETGKDPKTGRFLPPKKTTDKK